MSTGRVALEPFAGLAAVTTHTDAFTESGGAAALSGAGANHSVVYSTLGVRAATSIVLAPDRVLIPRVSAAWQHAFNGVTPTAGLAFVNTGVGFTVAGLPVTRDSALVEAGADLAFGRNVSVGLSYVGQLAAHAQDHAVNGRGVWRF
jgi:outer membrane autotransporter protein